MNAIKHIETSRKYLDYLEEHINNVEKAYYEVITKCKNHPLLKDKVFYNTLLNDVMNHDLSKFSKEEFTQYRDYFYPIGDKLSPLVEKEFKLAWGNHLKNNSHHHETLKNNVDVMHMVIDWTAMSYKFGDTAQKYYESNKDTIKLSRENEELLYEIFNYLK